LDLLYLENDGAKRRKAKTSGAKARSQS